MELESKMTEATLPPLSPVPAGRWQIEYDETTRDGYLRRKYDRDKRLVEHRDYLRRYAPEALASPPKGNGFAWIVDVGPGPGETLEWARQAGWRVLGVEAPDGADGMGNAYVRLSRLMHERQRILCLYLRWRGALLTDAVRHQTPGGVALLNFRGSWAQCHAPWLSGEPHDLHHDSSKQAWCFGESLRMTWGWEFVRMRELLAPGGHILISANRTGDAECQQRYDEEMRAAAEKTGLELVLHEPPLVHKWRKT